MMRSLGSVLAGTVTWTVLWLTGNQLVARVNPEAFDENLVTTSTPTLVTILVLSIVFSIVAGWLTARLAARAPVGHALALGVLQLAIGIFVQSQFWDVLPIWYHAVFLICLLPGNVLGGWLQSRARAETSVAVA